MGILTDSTLITAFKYTQPLTGVQLLDKDSCLTGWEYEQWGIIP